MVGVSLRLAILILPGTGMVELKHRHAWQAGILTGFRIMSGGDAEDGEYCCGADCGSEDAVRRVITLRQNSDGTHWSTRVHGHHCAVARRFGQSFLQLRRYSVYYVSKIEWEEGSYLCLALSIPRGKHGMV